MVDLVDEEAVEGLGAISSVMPSGLTAPAGHLSVVKATLVACFLLPHSSASL